MVKAKRNDRFISCQRTLNDDEMPDWNGATQTIVHGDRGQGDKVPSWHTVFRFKRTDAPASVTKMCKEV